MDARVGCLTVHAWYWMHPWRATPSAGGARQTTRRVGAPPLLPALPAGLGFAARLGLDLGLLTDLPFGSRRQV